MKVIVIKPGDMYQQPTKELMNDNVITTVNYQEIVDGKTVSKRIGNDTDKFSYGITANELITNTSKIGSLTVGEAMSNNIISNYNKGKQTANLVCRYGTYRDTTGNLVYTGDDGDTIKIGDYVTVLVRSVGKVVPFSKYADGSPMVFRVTSSEITHNGILNNSLKLLEVKQNMV